PHHKSPAHIGLHLDVGLDSVRVKRTIPGAPGDLSSDREDAETVERALSIVRYVIECRAIRFSGDRIRDMGALQAKLGSKKSPSQSTRGRTRSNTGDPRMLAREAAGATPDEATKTSIYRQSRRGFSVEVLATQFGLGRSRIERIIDEMRARRLL